MNKRISGNRTFRGTALDSKQVRVTCLILLIIAVMLLQASGSPYLTESTQAVPTVSPHSNEFPQYLTNSSGTYGSSTAQGSSTSQVNITVGKVEAFPTSNTFNDWTLVNSSVRLYAAPVFAGGVIYNGSNGDQAGTSITAINITSDGALGVSAVVVGAPYTTISATGCGGANSGAIFVFFGHTPLNSSYNLNQANLTVCGNETGMLFGWSVAGVANMTGPGGTGLAIGSPDFTYCIAATTNLGTSACSPTNAPHSGAVWTLTRAYLKTLYTNLKWKPGMHAVASIATVAYDYIANLGAYTVLKGEELGYSLSPIENTSSSGTSNPGHDDILAGAPYFNDTQGTAVGEAVVWNVPTSSVASLENPSNRTNSHYGWSVGNVSDPGGANRQDPVIGAPGSDTVYVYKGDYFAGDYGVYGSTVGTTIAEPVLYRIPGKPGSGFGWSVAGINHPANGAKPELGVGAPAWSPISVSSFTDSTQAQFQSSGSSLATSQKANNVFVYGSSLEPAAINLTESSTTTSFTWTTATGTNCAVTNALTSPVSVSGTTTSEFVDTSTACNAYEYTAPTFPALGDIQAYVQLASGNCLTLAGAYLSGGSLYFQAGVVMQASQFTYYTYSSYGAQGFFYPVHYSLNSWYKVDIVYNNVNYQYDVWINNVLAASNLTFSDSKVGAINNILMGVSYCYGKNYGEGTGYVNDLRLDEITTLSTGTYTSSYSTLPGTISNASLTVNASLQPNTWLKVQASCNGGLTWVTQASLAGNVSFYYSCTKSFGYRLLFYSSDPRFTPTVYSVRAWVGYRTAPNTGETLLFGNNTDLNDSGSYAVTSTADFSASGSSLSTFAIPYAPGNPWNYTVDPSGITDNGHLSLFLEEAFQDNFDNAGSTASTTALGNYTITHYTGGATYDVH